MEIQITKKDKERILRFSRIFRGIILITIGTLLMLKVIVPLMFAMVALMLHLINLYPLLDLNFKFVAGSFLLIIAGYILNKGCYIFLKILEMGLNILKLEKNHKGKIVKAKS